MNTIKKLVRGIIYSYRILTVCTFAPLLLVLLSVIFCVEAVAWCCMTPRYWLNRLHHWAFESTPTYDKPDLAWMSVGVLSEVFTASFLRGIQGYVWTGKMIGDKP